MQISQARNTRLGWRGGFEGQPLLLSWFLVQRRQWYRTPSLMYWRRESARGLNRGGAGPGSRVMVTSWGRRGSGRLKAEWDGSGGARGTGDDDFCGQKKAIVGRNKCCRDS